MLERVPLLEKTLSDYIEVAGEDTIERIRAAAAPLDGARMLHVNATAFGGGVAEILGTLVPLMSDLGLDADWQVIKGGDEFFTVTKAMHNEPAGRRLRVDAARCEQIWLDSTRLTTRTCSKASLTTTW